MIQLKSEINFSFIFYFLNFSNLNKLVFGSGQPLITGSQLKKLPIPIPPTKQEQTAIAQILSDMDNDIQTLETQRNKTLAIKQGMMQNLLTGKIRLLT